jgi:hypothetical protein
MWYIVKRQMWLMLLVLCVCSYVLLTVGHTVLTRCEMPLSNKMEYLRMKICWARVVLEG